MPRKFPWPSAPYVTLKKPLTAFHGKRVEYTEINAGRGPFGSTGRLNVSKANAHGKHQIHIVSTINCEGKEMEHAVPLQQKHVDSFQELDYTQTKAHFRCSRTIYS